MYPLEADNTGMGESVVDGIPSFVSYERRGYHVACEGEEEAR